MNKTPPAEDAPEFPGRLAAIFLGVALLVALFLVLVLAWRDNGRRAALETTAELTAVGDSHYYPLPAKAPRPPYHAVASFRGQPLYPTDYERHEFPADDMTRLGVDENGGFVIYRGPPRAKDADEAKLGSVYFLKVSPKEYLKTRPNLVAK
jgi:hypothetical protein